MKKHVKAVFQETCWKYETDNHVIDVTFKIIEGPKNLVGKLIEFPLTFEEIKGLASDVREAKEHLKVHDYYRD